MPVQDWRKPDILGAVSPHSAVIAFRLIQLIVKSDSSGTISCVDDTDDENSSLGIRAHLQINGFSMSHESPSVPDSELLAREQLWQKAFAFAVTVCCTFVVLILLWPISVRDSVATRNCWLTLAIRFMLNSIPVIFCWLQFVDNFPANTCLS